MGLDNGIRIKNFPKEDFKIFHGRSADKELEDNKEFELCYWRKCYGIRSAFINVLHISDEEYSHKIDSEDIPAIIRALKPFLSEEYWYEEGDSIWTFKEITDNLINSIICLEILKDYMEEHPDIEVYFYDSY